MTQANSPFSSVQEYYDEIVRRYQCGLLPARDSAGTCYYREGHRRDAEKRCVMGMLISDDAYSEKFEGKSVSSLSSRGEIEFPAWISWGQLADMQHRHDTAKDSDGLDELFRKFREILGLD